MEWAFTVIPKIYALTSAKTEQFFYPTRNFWNVLRNGFFSKTTVGVHFNI